MPADSRLAVVMDIGPAVHQRAGLSRYTVNLAGALLANHRDSVDLAVLYNSHSGNAPPLELAAAPAYPLQMGRYTWRLSALASQVFQFPYLPVNSRLAAFTQSAATTPSRAIYHATEHLLPNVAAPTVLTVHDLIFRRYPRHHTLTNRAFLNLAVPLFARRADAIIAVSRHTKRDLLELYGLPDEKVHVIYEGIDESFKPAPQSEQHRVHMQYSPDAPYLLMVGTLEPRKNHAAAFRALAALRQAGYPHRLLIAGGDGWLFSPVRQLPATLGLDNQVSFLGYVSHADLLALYSAADCFLAPSLYEGFGFPVLEAMACGAPVVCSDASSLPEIAGDAALIVSPHDDAGLVNAIRLIIDQPQFAARLRELGQARAATFRWDHCAAETVDVYRHVAELRGR
ncbi:MAG: glycosyltransferase family 1 protein [Chloroflexota bacterium]|jgi:glycosyltransferase involved in cell wall biosynthesis|nr:glycosyltransferase family 1 protein [Chloroflexota bacterium]